MGRRDRTIMQIPREHLEEKNYEGTRLIEVTDPTILKLRLEIAKLQKPAEPHLKKMEEHAKTLDPFYQKITALNNEIKKFKEEMAPTKAIFDEGVSELEKIEARAQLIKNKLQPLVNKYIEGSLREFETPIQVVEKEGKVYVEIQDEIEEKIKQVRAKNTQKKK